MRREVGGRCPAMWLCCHTRSIRVIFEKQREKCVKPIMQRRDATHGVRSLGSENNASPITAPCAEPRQGSEPVFIRLLRSAKRNLDLFNFIISTGSTKLNHGHYIYINQGSRTLETSYALQYNSTIHSMTSIISI